VQPPREENITDAVADHLRPEWRILGVHHPGASGGVRLRPEAGWRLGDLQDIIPDVLATRGSLVLLVESKPRYSPEDQQKLRSVVSSGAYVEHARTLAGLPAAVIPVLIPALAFCPRGPEPSPEGFVVFHYSQGKVVVACGSELLASA
jgi:hypothetical protein